MKNFLKILSIAARYKGYALLNIIFNILGVVFNIFSLGLLIPVLEVLFRTENQAQKILEQDPGGFTLSNAKDYFYYQLTVMIDQTDKADALLYICLILLVMTTLKNLCRYLAMYFLAVVRNKTVRDLRNNIYDKILTLPISYFNEERKGDVMAKASNDVQEVEWSVMASMESVFREPIAILLFVTVLISLSWSLTLFIFVLLPVAGLIIGRIGKSLKRTSAEGQNKMGHLLSILEETLGGMRIIKAFNAEDDSSKRFKSFNSDYTQTMIRMYRKRDLASPLSEWLGILVVIAVLTYGASLVFSGSLEPSFFMAYLALFAQLINPVKALSNASYHVQKGSASMDRINKILNAPEKITNAAKPLFIEEFKDKIECKEVYFKYQNTHVLQNINLELKKGETIALVGPSGGGKSTLADLLPRFHDPVKGEVLIDGVNIKDVDVKSLRAQMGIVTQQSILFNDTVAGNIAFGKKEASREEIISAAKVANAHEFIEQLEGGYDFNIGDSGNKLSGGQKQRLSIARAVLQNPSVLILDEATSALDTESETLVQEALDNLMKNRTSLVIAHRLSTIRNADRIIVLKNGKIVESGSHDELLKLNKTYRKLHDLQNFN